MVGTEPVPPISATAWQTQLSSPGDPAAGERLFFHPKVAACFRCHEQDGRGANIGPDLTALRGTLTKERLLESLLTPSKEIAPRYTPWLIETKDGRVLTGLYVDEEVDGRCNWPNQRVRSSASIRGRSRPRNQALSRSCRKGCQPTHGPRSPRSLRVSAAKTAGQTVSFRSCSTLHPMQNVIIEKPYEFVPPHRGTFWSSVIQKFGLQLRHLRRKEGVESYEIRHAERLKQSLAADMAYCSRPIMCEPPTRSSSVGWLRNWAVIFTRWRVGIYSIKEISFAGRDSPHGSVQR